METFKDSIDKHNKVFKSLHLLSKKIENAIDICTVSIQNNNKIIICGNGGSASDAQHLAAEFIGRFTVERKSLPAICLNTDTSALTCIANDYSYEKIFERQLNALGCDGDVLIVFSTSGNSKNIINVCELAQKMKIKVIGFLGKGGGQTLKHCDVTVIVDSQNTANIQEAHIFLAHFLCGEVEKRLGLV